jgi:hypothetical protein
MSNASAQDLLWSVPNFVGDWWWVACAIFAFPAALLCFLYLIMNEKFTIVILSRAILSGGMMLIGLTPLNSGCLPWGVLLVSTGGCLAYFLLATNWCAHDDKWAIVKAWIRGGGHRQHDNNPGHRASD